MLAEFLAWWGAQLWSLVPERFRNRAGAQAQALVIEVAASGALSLLRRRRGLESRLGPIGLDAAASAPLRTALSDRQAGEILLLRLPETLVLERAVTLPLAAERDPERVLGYEMERLTPFAADEVFWAWAVETRDRALGRLGLRLTLVPRATIQGLLQGLASLGARPALIEATTSQGIRPITLSHETPTSRRAALTRHLATGLAAALALLVLTSPFLRQSLSLAAAEDQLAALAPRMKQVDALRRRIAGTGAGTDAVAAETRRLGDMLEALAAVTEILPDDSYLTEFTMRERKMTLSGLSASAPKLISALSDDPRIADPSFTAPVTRTENGHQDVFSIRATLAP